MSPGEPPLEVAFRLDLPHGRCVGVLIPATLPARALASLPAEERALAEQLGEARRSTFVAGRVALRAALVEAGLPAGPLLATDRGAPLVPPGTRGSISHKRTLAVGLAARADPERHIGVDLEENAPLRVDVSRRVLTGAESARLAALPPEGRARALLLHLSAKEALYKALDPFVRRYVSFQEAALTLRDDGTALVTLALSGGEGPFLAEVCHREVWAGRSFFLTSATIRKG
jgi:enterobactin synthetase component D